jgi:hypothetical protein
VPYHPKTGEQSFNSSWQKAVAWAQSNGIGPSSYLPVYQLDLTRLQNGEYPMGAAERNLSIMAAHNPNQVTSNPADHPASPFTPSGAFHNAVSDVGKIATGIAGIFTGSFEKQVWDSAKTTFKGVIHPATLEGSGFGGTIGNWLNKTLLSYVPGMADIGTVLQADPTLTGSKGFEALAQHPLLSVLDVVPGAGGAVERLAGKVGATQIAASLAARGGDKSFISEAAKVVGGKTLGKTGVNLKGELGKLSVADHIQLLAARGGRGVGPALSHLGDALQTTSMMTADMYTWLLDGPTQMAKHLSKEEAAYVKSILDTRHTDGGNRVRETLDNPATSPAVKDFIRTWLNGPLRFAKEEEMFAGGIRPAESLNGDVGIWSTSGVRSRRVFKAQAAMKAAERAAVQSVIGLSQHVGRVEHLDEMLGESKGQFAGALTAARQQVFADPKLARPLTRELPKGTKFRARGSINRVDQLHAVVGEGGLADQFMKAVESGDADLIGELAKAMRERLSAWGPKSVNAAEHPTLVALRETAVAFENWAKYRKKESRAIQRSIHEEIGRQEHHFQEQMAHRSEQMQILRDRQKRERAELDEGYRKAKAQRAGTLANKVRDATQARVMYEESVVNLADTQARRATRHVLNTQIMPEVRRRIYEFNQYTAATIKDAKRKYLADNKLAWTEKQRDSSRMVARHKTETQRFMKKLVGEQVGMGEDLRVIRAYGKTIQAFHEAVKDNPSDAYRDVYVELLQKHLREMEQTSALVMVTDRHLSDIPRMNAKKLQQLRSDPQVIFDLLRTHSHELMNQPDLGPEVAREAMDEWKAMQSDAREELTQLIGRGLRIEYIPSATSFDERLGRDSMTPLIGHGIPKPDIAKERVWDLTPNKHDFALGINKAVVQALQRDATIHFAEEYLRPLTLNQRDVDKFLLVDRTEQIVGRGEDVNVPHVKMKLTAEDLGLEVFDPHAMFGFRLPRWSPGETLYLPKPLVGALRQFERERRAGLLAKGNKLFRYSILGLSPRYTAHILFGGSMMLALRSNPEAIGMIGQAARALRDGTIPSQVFRGPAELGFESPIDLFHQEAAKDAVNMAVGEHIETRQKVKAAAATPLHALRAMADLNFRFTHYVRDLQAAVAYLDGAAQVTRRDGKVTMEDPETGREITVTPDRAVKEGIHHVQEVFGNLHAMSPLERQIAQSFMPFYGWQKHILGYIMKFPFDHPWRALVLSQMAMNASNDVPLAYPLRIQFLHFLGGPDKNGNINAIDLRSLDPFRDVANYASLQGVFQALNPAITALPSVANPEFTYGSSQLYPGVTYNSFYGIRQATSGGSWLNAVEQFVPQTAAVQSALTAAGGIRSQWQTNRSSAIKSMLNSLNIPFVTPPVNLKQVAAKDEASRFEVAKAAAQTAFQSGDFSGLAGYKTVPNPLNSAFEITPAELEQVYKQAQQATPGVAPIESLLPPPTPYGW